MFVSLVVPRRIVGAPNAPPSSGCDARTKTSILLQLLLNCMLYIWRTISKHFHYKYVYKHNKDVNVGIYFVNVNKGQVKVNKYLVEFALICQDKDHKSQCTHFVQISEKLMVASRLGRRSSMETKGEGPTSLPHGHFLCKFCRSSL